MGRAVIGGLMGVAAGAMMAYAILGLIDLGSCFGACTDQVALVPYLGGSIVLLIASTFVWRGSFVLAPVAGLLVAGLLALRDGVQLDGMTLWLTAVVVLSVLSGPLILSVIWARGHRRNRIAQELVATGSRAVAVVQGVRQTGLVINHLPQVEVTYQIRPLDGTPAFSNSKKQVVSYGEIAPRPGLAWPAWYDPTDHSRVAVGAPTGAAIDQATQARLAEFGITVEQAYGYNPLGAAGQGAPAGPTGFGAPGGFGG